MNSPTHRSNIIKTFIPKWERVSLLDRTKEDSQYLLFNCILIPRLFTHKFCQSCSKEIFETQTASAATKESSVIAQVESKNQDVLGEQTNVPLIDGSIDSQKQPSWVESTLTSPRQITTIIFILLLES